MAIDNNSTVGITIQVRDDGSIAIIDAAEAKLVKLQNVSVGAGNAAGKAASAFGLAGANLGVFGSSIQSTTQGLTGFSNASIKVTQDTEEASKATQKLHGNMREVSGTARELGLNMGYSMRRFLAESPAVMAGLKAMSGAFIALSVIDIGVEVVKGVGKLYEEWFDVNKAVDEYTQKAQQAAQEKLIETGSIETTASMLGQIGDELDKLQAKRAAFNKAFDIPGTNINMPGAGFLQYGQYLDPLVQMGIKQPTTFSSGDDQRTAQLAEAQKKGQEHLLDSTGKVAEQQLQGQQAYDQAVDLGYAKIAAHERDTVALINQRYAVMKANEGDLAKTAGIKPADLDKSYSAEQQAEINRARQEAAGDRIAMSRQETEQVIQMENQAVEAGLRGNALLERQRIDAIDAVVRKAREGNLSQQAADAETAALEQKYSAARLQQIQEEYDKARRMQQDSTAAGLTGVPKIQAEAADKQYDLYKDMNGDLGAIYHAREAIAQETDQQIAEAHQQFAQKIEQIDQRSSDQMQSGYARIAGQANQELDRLTETYTEYYGKDENAWMGYQDRKLQIAQNADRERAQYARQVDEQITQIESEAAKASLPPWQAAQAEILDQYQQRVQKANNELSQQLSYEKLTVDDLQNIWGQYYRTIAADGALAAAQIQKQMEQTRDQVAGQLEQMFSNPAKYMENRAKQMMMDIVANWVTQLMQANPTMQGAIGGILGMNKMGTSANPLDAMKSMFGAHADAGGGSTLMSAGSTLSSSGTMLAGSAARLSSSATALMQAASMFSSSSGTSAGGGAGQIGQLSDMISGAAGTSGSTAIAGGFGGGSAFASGIGGLPGTGGGGLSGALSVANTVGSAAGVGGPMGAATGIAGTAGSIAQMTGLFSGSTQMLNPGGAGGFGGLQATDLPPTNSAGVLGTVPDSPTGTGGFSDDGGGITAGQGMGMAMAGLSTGIGLYQAWSSGNALGATLTGAMGGASIGMMAGGPLGAGIGAGIGALVGFLGSLFSDGGLSKAKHYNTDVVLPGIQKEMNSFTGGGGGYDQASQDLNNLMVQAQQQCKSFGSQAMSYYNSTIVGEITAAQAQIDRMSEGGRANVTMSTAQFDSGGVVTSFGDMSTGPFSGFVHMSLGERVMNPMASMMHGPVLDAMNSGSATLSMMRRSAPLGGSAGGPSGSPIIIQTLDHKTMGHWLRMGGAQILQSAINGNTSRYAGKALG